MKSKWTITGAIAAIGAAVPMVGWVVFQGLVGLALIAWGLILLWDIVRPDAADQQLPDLSSESSTEKQTGDTGPSPSARGKTQFDDIIALKSLGYGEPIWIPTRGVSTDSDGSQTAIQTMPPETSSDDFVFQNIVSTKPDRSRLSLQAMVLLNKYSWKKGEHDLFEGESPKGISPLKALPRVDVRQRVETSIITYCVGLSSTEFRPAQTFDNTRLSDNRAIQLCTALVQLGYLNSRSKIQRTVAIGLGERLAASNEQLISPSRQRAAVIIGVSEITAEHTEADVVDAIVNGLSVAGVQLSNYERSDGNEFMIYDIKDSEFYESQSAHWRLEKGLTKRRVLSAEIEKPAEE